MPGACLCRLELGKFGFPETQDVGFGFRQAADLTQSKVELVGYDNSGRNLAAFGLWGRSFSHEGTMPA